MCPALISSFVFCTLLTIFYFTLDNSEILLQIHIYAFMGIDSALCDILLFFP